MPYGLIMRKLFILSFLLLLPTSFAFSQSAADKKIESAIAKVMNDQAAAWNRGDLEGYMAGYWRSADLIFISGDNVTRGWQPTFDRYKKGYDSREKMGVLTFDGIEVHVLAKDAAVVLGSWHLKRKSDDPHGKFTLTFRKFKQGWRIIMDHTS